MEEGNQTTKKSVKNKKDKSKIFTKETLGVVLVLFATLCLICLITGDKIFSIPGIAVREFLLGMLGYSAYLVLAYAIFMSVLLIADKKTGFSLKRKIYMTSSVIVLCLIIHVITMRAYAGLTYGEYLAESYRMGGYGAGKSSGSGLLLSLISYVVTKLLTSVGSYVVLGAILCLLVYGFVNDVIKNKNSSQPRVRGSYVINNVSTNTAPSVNTTEEMAYPVDNVEFPNLNSSNQRLFVNNADDFGFRTKKEIKNEERARNNVAKPQPTNAQPRSNSYPNTYGQSFSQEMQEKLDYIRTPSPITPPSTSANGGTSSSTSVSNAIPMREERKADDTPIVSIGNVANEAEENSASSHANDFYDRYGTYEADEPAIPTENIEETPTTSAVPEVEETYDEPEIESNTASEEVVESPAERLPASRIRDIFNDDDDAVAVGDEDIDDIMGEEPPTVVERTPIVERTNRNVVTNTEEKKPKVEPPINRPYNKPPITLLKQYVAPSDLPEEDHEGRKEIIKKTLSEFRIDVEVEGHVQGPAFTRYEVKMPAGISVTKVTGYDDDLKMRLAVHGDVRIEAPIPGKNLIGIEVANKQRVTVGLREIMEGMEKKVIKPTALEFAVGKDIVGDIKSDNLAKGPHYLVAGATGQGKSVFLNTLIISLIMRYSPEDLKLILIDPKQVEFKIYSCLPHLLTPEIIIDPQKALTSLTWAINEMEKRYQMFSNSGGRVANIESYNEHVASDTVPKMPRIVIIIDELADLMSVCKKDLEARISRLAAKARAAGIHLVLATQRPSVDVITGTIKNNFPSRVAFTVSNFNDSQTIIGGGGAEKLLGAGDMLYKTATMANCERYQGAFISEDEIYDIIEYVKNNNTAYFDEEFDEFLNKTSQPKQEESKDDDDGGSSSDIENEDLFVKALEVAISQGQTSISQLKRKFPIGYSKAGKLIDKMESLGYISGFDGAKPRTVFITREEFEKKYGDRL